MSWLTRSLSSTMGKKLIVAATGLFLCTFLVVHLIGNLQLLKNDGGEAFNHYAVFMTSNPLIKTVSYLLYASILGHAFYGLYVLGKRNTTARPVAYNTVNNSSAWTSRSMGVLGTMILAFIVGHMFDFWREYHEYLGYKFEYYVTYADGKPMKNLYSEVMETFKSPIFAFGYVLAMLPIAFHLSHGFQSGFQTLGLNHPKYTPFIKSFGNIFSWGIMSLYALIPIWVFFDLGSIIRSILHSIFG